MFDYHLFGLVLCICILIIANNTVGLLYDDS